MRRILILFLPIIIAICIANSAKAKESDTCISETAYKACIEYGKKCGIAPELLMAVIETESEGNSYAKNGGCCGLMQINPKWHKERMQRLGVSDIFDERNNILVGTDYLSELFEEYQDVAYVLDVYNGNSKAKENYENGIVSDYSEKILERSAELEILHGK